MLDQREQYSAQPFLVIRGLIPFPFGPGKQRRVDGEGRIDLAILAVGFAANEAVLVLPGVAVVEARDEQVGLRAIVGEVQYEAAIPNHSAAPGPPGRVAEEVGHRLMVEGLRRKYPDARSEEHT